MVAMETGFGLVLELSSFYECIKMFEVQIMNEQCFVSLQAQVRELIGSNQMLEHRLRLCRTGRDQEVGRANTEEINRMRKAFQEQVSDEYHSA